MTKNNSTKKAKGRNTKQRVENVPRGLVPNTPIIRYTRPQVQQAYNGNIRVQHSEQLLTVSNAGTLGWAKNHFGLNPTDSNYFPWLKSIANNYAKYRWHKLQVRFVSTSPTTQTGEVRFGALYDHQELAQWVIIPTFVAQANAIVSMNSNVVCPAYGTTTAGGLGIAWDTNQIHSRVPWLLTTGNGTITEATDNQRVGAYLANLNFFQFANSSYGHLMVDYDVEFTQSTFGGVAGASLFAKGADDCQLTDWQIYVNKLRREAGLPEEDCLGFNIVPKPPPAPRPPPAPKPPPEEPGVPEGVDSVIDSN